MIHPSTPGAGDREGGEPLAKTLGGAAKVIPLSDSAFVTVDECDCELIAGHTWFVHRNKNVKYAATNVGGRFAYMHKLIMRPPEGFLVDHINGDGMDNRRSNLRIVTRHQNNFNQSKRRDALHSQYKGVSMDGSRRSPWYARIKFENKTHKLGWFKTELEAALAYDEAAKKYFGEYARLNIPPAATSSAPEASPPKGPLPATPEVAP